MRVLFVTPTSYPEVGGLQSYVHYLCKHLANQGDDVLLFTLQSEPDPLAPERNYHYFRVQKQNQPLRDNWLFLVLQKVYLGWQLYRAMKSHRADYLFCAYWDPLAYLSAVVCIVLRKPYFCAVHGQEIFNLPRGPLRRQVKRFLRWVGLHRARRLFAVSSYTKRRLTEIGCPPNHISVYPNGVEIRDDISLTIAEAKRQLGLTDSKVILQVSRLAERKGQDRLIEALPLILQEVPNAVYVVVGSGPRAGILKALVAQYGLAEYVRFCGLVPGDELPVYYQACDVYVMPCRETKGGRDFEGFGITILESYLHGKPVVIGRSGGVEDAVFHGVTGLLVDPNNVEEIAKAVIRLLQDEELNHTMGIQSKHIVQEKFNWASIVNQIRADIHQCLTGNR